MNVGMRGMRLNWVSESASIMVSEAPVEGC